MMGGISGMSAGFNMGRMQAMDSSKVAERIFSKSDADGDGSLSIGELNSGRKQFTEADFGNMDTDGNGSINQDELASNISQRREKIAEKIKSGEIDPSQLNKMRGRPPQGGQGAMQGMGDSENTLNALLEILNSEEDEAEEESDTNSMWEKLQQLGVDVTA